MSERRPRKATERKGSDRRNDKQPPADRKPGRRGAEPAGPPPDAGQLPELEPVDELPELEPVEAEALPELEPEDDSPVRVTCQPAAEAGFDLGIEVAVPEMEKAAVADAVAGPLRRAVANAGVRHRRVLVQFSGQALIGTAVKQLAGEVLAAAKALKVVVRRGYGDETVHEGALPQARVQQRRDGDTVRVEIDAAGVAAEDLQLALQPELDKLAADAAGKALTFAFAGAARPDAQVRGRIRQLFADAGASRVAIGDQVLFDRELEARVRLTGSGEQLAIAIDAADDEAVTLAAMALVLRAGDLAGKRVQVAFQGPRPPRAVKTLIELCQQGKPARCELARPPESADVLWPPLLDPQKRGDETVLAVRADGRDRSAVVAAFRREVDGHQAAIAGRAVTVDWPKDFAVDAGIERDCLSAVGALAPRSIACSWAGDNKEPFLPLPVAFATAADGSRVIRIDTDAGKPPELARAIERRLGSGGDLRGQRVRIEISGAGAASRTMLRTLLGIVEKAGASRLDLDDHGHVDVLLPPLLRIEQGGNGFRVAANKDTGGRDQAQVEHALQRELDAAEVPAGAVFIVAPSPLADAIVAAAIGRLARKVVLDGQPPVQVHPPLLSPPRQEGDRLLLRAAPGADAAAIPAQIERELPPLLAALGELGTTDVTLVWPGAQDPKAEPLAGLLRKLETSKPQRLLLDDGSGKVVQVWPVVVLQYVVVLGSKDAATPPLSMLGIDHGSGDEHTAAVLGKLQELGALLDGRAVLLVRRDHGRDVAVDDADPLQVKVRELVDARAAATLCFRGRDAARRPHFQVVHSTVEKLAVGSLVADPRLRR